MQLASILNHPKMQAPARLAANNGLPRAVAALTKGARGGIGLGQIRTF